MAYQGGKRGNCILNLKKGVKMITHRPKGTMCIYCKNFQGDAAIANCPTHDQLTKMRQLKKDKDGVIVVKCEKFEGVNADASVIVKGNL